MRSLHLYAMRVRFPGAKLCAADDRVCPIPRKPITVRWFAFAIAIACMCPSPCPNAFSPYSISHLYLYQKCCAVLFVAKKPILFHLSSTHSVSLSHCRCPPPPCLRSHTATKNPTSPLSLRSPRFENVPNFHFFSILYTYIFGLTAGCIKQHTAQIQQNSLHYIIQRVYPSK